MKKVINIVDKCLVFLNHLGGFCLAAMMLLITFDVFLRAVFKRPVMGMMEIIQVTAVLIVFFGFGYNAFRDEHIRVELFHKWPVIDYITDLFSVVVMCCMFYGALGQAQLAANINLETQLLAIPLAPVKYFVAFGYIVLTLGIIFGAIKKFLDTKEKNELKEIAS